MQNLKNNSVINPEKQLKRHRQFYIFQILDFYFLIHGEAFFFLRYFCITKVGHNKQYFFSSQLVYIFKKYSFRYCTLVKNEEENFCRSAALSTSLIVTYT